MQAMLVAAKAMARTALRVLEDDALLQSANEEFQRRDT
jgi:hypothetical protein